MTEASAIRATFSDFRPVKTRGVMQFVFEVPIESADAALRAFGGVPQPAQERWCAIARLQESGAETAVILRPAASGPTLPAKSAGPTSPTPSGLPPPLPPAAPEGRQQSPGSGDAREAPPTRMGGLPPSKERIDRVWPDKPRTPFHQKPLSQQAAILCRDVAFQLWASAHLEGDPVREPKSCEIWLKRKLGIVSFTELDDTSINSDPSQRQFRGMVEQFEKSVGRIPA